MTVQHAQAAARFQAISDLLAAEGRVDVVDIASRLGVAQETIRRDLRDVTRKTRPDWDLGTPGLREAWEAGDVAPFHGWDRRGARSGT